MQAEVKSASPALPSKTEESLSSYQPASDAGHTPYPKGVSQENSPTNPHTVSEHHSANTPVPIATSSNHNLNETFDATTESKDKTFSVSPQLVPNNIMDNCAQKSNLKSDATYVISGVSSQCSSYTSSHTQKSHPVYRNSVNNRTVTKSTATQKSVPAQGDAQKNKKNVVRSMDFASHQLDKENCPSPAGKAKNMKYYFFSQCF